MLRLNVKYFERSVWASMCEPNDLENSRYFFLGIRLFQIEIIDILQLAGKDQWIFPRTFMLVGPNMPSQQKNIFLQKILGYMILETPRSKDKLQPDLYISLREISFAFYSWGLLALVSIQILRWEEREPIQDAHVFQTIAVTSEKSTEELWQIKNIQKNIWTRIETYDQLLWVIKRLSFGVETKWFQNLEFSSHSLLNFEIVKIS